MSSCILHGILLRYIAKETGAMKLKLSKNVCDSIVKTHDHKTVGSKMKECNN